MCYSLEAFKGYIPPRNPWIFQVSLFPASLISLSASKPALCPPFQAERLWALSPCHQVKTGSKLGVGDAAWELCTTPSAQPFLPALHSAGELHPKHNSSSCTKHLFIPPHSHLEPWADLNKPIPGGTFSAHLQGSKHFCEGWTKTAKGTALGKEKEHLKSSPPPATGFKFSMKNESTKTSPNQALREGITNPKLPLPPKNQQNTPS